MSKFMAVSFVAGAIALATTPAHAQDESELFDFYGKLSVGVQYSDLDDGTDSDKELTSYASRFGVKGSTKLEGDLEVIYQLEWEVDVTDLGGSDNIKSRNQFIGLKGAFGEVTAGRRDTALKLLQSGFDPFSDYEGDMKHIFAGKNRMSDTISYFSPSFNNFQVAASYVFAEDDLVDDGMSMTVTYGDKKFTNTDFYVGFGVDDAVKGKDIVRAVAMTKVGTTQVGVLWQDQEDVDGTNQADGYVANVVQPWNEFTFKLQYQIMDFADGDESSLAAGVDYKLGKNTKLFGWYTGRDLDNVDAEQRYVAFGIEHKF
jgi:predicted porin